MFGTNVLRKQDKEADGTLLYVQSIFSTIQGEGPFGGRPAIFLRLSGCNLACFFCDTDFESKREMMTVTQVVEEIERLAKGGLEKARRTTLVVITGGEPLLQKLAPLIEQLVVNRPYEVQLETAGTVWQDGLERFLNAGMLTIVCSPKTGKVHPKIAEHCYDWKYLIQEGFTSEVDGLPAYSTQVEGKPLKLFRPTWRAHDQVWLQPCEAYKVGYKTVRIMTESDEAEVLREQPLADQAVTGSARDEVQSRRNIELCAYLAVKYNYRVSLQLHKILGLP